MLKANLMRVAIVPVAFALVFAISAPASAKEKRPTRLMSKRGVSARKSSIATTFRGRTPASAKPRAEPACTDMDITFERRAAVREPSTVYGAGRLILKAETGEDAHVAGRSARGG